MNDPSEALANAVAARDLATLVALEHAAHARDPEGFELFGPRYAMALVPGVDAALTTIETLRARGLLLRPPSGHVPSGCPHLPPGRFVRRKSGAIQHADWAARQYGGVLAFTHAGDAEGVLDAVVSRFGEGASELHDLYACFLQECVVRGADLAEVASAHRLAAALTDAGHPLAVLPLARLGLEAGLEACASTYGVRSSGGWHAAHAPPEASSPSAPPAVTLDDVTAPSDARIAAVFESHCQVSNGKSEARVYWVSPSAEVSDVGLVRALARAPSLRCLDGLDPLDDTLEVRRYDAARAFEALLVFASNGGDYNLDWSAAHGRLAAWRSLGGLVDAPADASLPSIEARAGACRFLHFRAPTPWFYRVVTDLGLVVVRDDLASVALLAGSDTD